MVKCNPVRLHGTAESGNRPIVGDPHAQDSDKRHNIQRPSGFCPPPPPKEHPDKVKKGNKDKQKENKEEQKEKQSSFNMAHFGPFWHGQRTISNRRAPTKSQLKLSLNLLN